MGKGTGIRMSFNKEKYGNYELYNGITVRQMQNKMIEILKYFIKICEENNLRYWCGGGSMLGAVRHQGFIPWDDDIDVFMPRPDYERLYEIWNQIGDRKNYSLFRTNSKHNMHTANMHLVDIHTTFIHKHNKEEDIPHGVYIDIAPFDGCPSNIALRGSQIYHAILFSVYNVQRLPDNQGEFLKIPAQILLSLVKDPKKRYRIWKKHEKAMAKYNYDDCRYVKEIMTSFKGLFRLYPKKYFERRDADFEDITIRIPYHAEEYLSRIYGDYKKLPPENKRMVRFDDIVYIDLAHSYRKYKGIYYMTGKNRK